MLGKLSAAVAKQFNTDAMVGQIVSVSGRVLIVDSLLANGGFGSVYLVKTLPQRAVQAIQGGTTLPLHEINTIVQTSPEFTQESFVLKKMYAASPELAKQLTSEVTLMEHLSKVNVNGVVRVICSERTKVNTNEGTGLQILVVMELCPGGHLLTRLNGLREQKKVLPWTKVLEVFVQIVKPIAGMHALQPSPVAHRDLKFENVLIAKDGSLRLCDFGSASSHTGPIKDKMDRAEQEDAILRYTTPHFRSPEMCDLFNNEPLDERSDVWALGCMLYGLAYYSHPFQETGNLAIMSARYKLPTSPSYPAPIHTIIRACLQYHPDQRPSAVQIVTYIEDCLKVGGDASSASAFPAIRLSGGGSFVSAVIAPPAPGSEGALPDGCVMVTGVSKMEGGGAGATPYAHGASMHKSQQSYHVPTAQDILQQVQSQALASAVASSSTTKSSALQNRLKGKSAAATNASGTVPPIIAHSLQSSGTIIPSQDNSSSRSSSSSSSSSSASSSSFADFGSMAAPTSTSKASVPITTSGGFEGFDDFDSFGSSSGSVGTSTAVRARAPSGDSGLETVDSPPELPPRSRQTATAPALAPPVAAEGGLDLDFFNSSTTLQKDEDDPFSQKSVSVVKTKNELDDFFS